MEKKIRTIGPAGRKAYQHGYADAYVSGSLKNGYYVIASTRRKMAYTLPKKHRTKNAAIKAAKAFVLKRG